MKQPSAIAETARLRALSDYEIIDTKAEREFDDLAHLAGLICQTPTALISLVDDRRQWFKSCIGLDVRETPRDVAFCAHTILQPQEMMIVEDATVDARFRNNPLVTNQPHIHFYAGAPLVTPDGFALGSICVIDYVPRTLSAGQQDALKALARQVVSQLELRRTLRLNEAISHRSRQILAQASDGIHLFDFNGRILTVNRKFCELTGRTEAELLTLKVADLIHPEDLEQLPTRFEELRTGATRITQRRFLRPDKSVVTVEISAKKFDEKTIQAIVRDITERKKMEDELFAARDAALESARLKSAFLTNVSHEIRTPMNGVIGMTELLLDTALDCRQREFAETIRQSADALLVVINDILDLAKIESGKLRFEAVDFDVREVVESTVEMFAGHASGKNIEIASRIAVEIPPIVRGDPGRLRQILTNLVGNAVKFTAHGEIKVEAGIQKQDAQHTVLRFDVSDTGIGIEEKHLKNLFQPFVQIDDSTTREYGGTGLGLIISKQLTEMMNGEISVESQPQKGSRFSFTASFANRQSARTETAAHDGRLELFRHKKILIADRAEIVRRALKEYVSAWQADAEEASSGEQTLRRLNEAVAENAPFDAVILDVNLPDWEGFSLARRIKADSSLNQTHIVLTTAYGQKGDAAQAKDSGATAYLTKPIRGGQIFDCLAAVFAGGARAGENQRDAAAPLVTRHSLREAKAAETPATVFDEQTFSLLVVEDNEINRRMISHQLKRGGLTAEMAFDGVDALEKIAEKEYRIILMDCQMPRLDGYQTTREIRRLEQEKTARGESFTPATIIALTAHTFAGEREKCLAAGMNDYLSKPVKNKELFAALELWRPNSEFRRDNPDASVS